MTAVVSDKGRELLLRYEQSLDCVHCGLCLPECPTYRDTGNEVASPRGRIYLMRGLAEGALELTPNFGDQMELCLVCRACESVCPSGVQFSQMMEVTRHEMHRAGRGGFIGRIMQRIMLDFVIPRRRVLALTATLTRLYRVSRISALLRFTRLNRLLPRTLRAMEAALPEVPPAAERAPLPTRIAATSGIAPRGRVAILRGCVMEQLFGAVNRSTADALAAQGYEVLVPESQTCCGALHAHAGDLEAARDLARRNVEAFESLDVEHIVLNAAGCGAAMTDYGHWLAGDPAWAARAQAVADKVVDVLVLFDRERLEPRGSSGERKIRATYDAPCHLHHGQRCGPAPLNVIARMPGLDLVPLRGAEDCCGAAGIYNVTQPEMSGRILAEKITRLRETNAELLFTGNPGCMLQWRRGIAEAGLAVEVRHPVELL